MTGGGGGECRYPIAEDPAAVGIDAGIDVRGGSQIWARILSSVVCCVGAVVRLGRNTASNEV